MARLFKIGNEVINEDQIAFVDLDFHGRGFQPPNEAVCIYFAFQADDLTGGPTTTKGPYTHVIANPPDVKAVKEYFTGRAATKA